MARSYRDNGAIGALLDEYENVLNDLKNIILNIGNQELTHVVNNQSGQEEFASIQTILAHVVQAGYTYAVEIQKHIGIDANYTAFNTLESTTEYISALDEMFEYNVNLFNKNKDIEIVNYDNNTKIKVRWGQSYDIDQLLEHAIVHIMRHRRQIERYLIKISMIS